jgi:hypothetical protein
MGNPRPARLPGPRIGRPRQSDCLAEIPVEGTNGHAAITGKGGLLPRIVVYVRWGSPTMRRNFYDAVGYLHLSVQRDESDAIVPCWKKDDGQWLVAFDVAGTPAALAHLTAAGNWKCVSWETSGPDWHGWHHALSTRVPVTAAGASPGKVIRPKPINVRHDDFSEHEPGLFRRARYSMPCDVR